MSQPPVPPGGQQPWGGDQYGQQPQQGGWGQQPQGPYGQPQGQQYGAYGQPGPYGQPPYGQPPKDNKNTVIALSIGAVVVVAAVVVALVVFLGGGDDAPTVAAPPTVSLSLPPVPSIPSISLPGSSGSDDSGTFGTLVDGTPTSPDGLGDDPQLDEYAQDCYDGSAEGCLNLYAASPIDSDYEKYAESCGGRVEWTESSTVFDCIEY